MKKVFMMMALLAIPFAMMGQTKFHDVEFNEANGPVKKIVSSTMGREQVINFTKEGKMEREGLTNAVYDANGFLQSATMTMMQGQAVDVKYKWENGRVVSQSMSMMGRDMTTKRTYNDKGAVAAESMDMGGQEMNIPYTDYKYDDHGNWISRKTSMMGQEMVQTRTIEYYE
ncbi:hypothetical protein SAMN02910409_0985 [Prevotellaceae bacterium HUN156]|nr:hypothetical protein SAMN02910409_0985 [Prevotellaceae bacterium HUN156]